MNNALEGINSGLNDSEEWVSEPEEQSWKSLMLKRKKRNKENSTELQKPIIEAEVYNYNKKKCV